MHSHVTTIGMGHNNNDIRKSFNPTVTRKFKQNLYHQGALKETIHIIVNNKRNLAHLRAERVEKPSLNRAEQLK